MTRQICLITPGHISSTPRLVKEADALAEAGYRVHVIAGRHFAPVFPLDAEVLASARWQFTAVTPKRGLARVAARLARWAARRQIVRSGSADLQRVAIALQPGLNHLVAAAVSTRADYFIGHCMGGIAAAATAARLQGMRFGVDLEDFHDRETAAAVHDPAEGRGRRLLQQAVLPCARHLTAASPLIADAYARAYAVSPSVVLNTFPRAQAPANVASRVRFSSGTPARIYWFSQTIGPGRGLEAVARILGRMRTPVELQLRGFDNAQYLQALQAHATKAGLARPIRVLVPASPVEMARLAADADLGLSVEEREPLNRDLCLTNKIFIYLLAGIPQFLSHTTAQAALAPELGEAAMLGSLDAPEASATQLDALLADPDRLQRARHTAWQLAQERFCWDLEKERFLALVGAATREGS